MAYFASIPDEFPVVSSDFSELEGTCCYCSEESSARIRAAISGLPLEAVHTIGTGDYHYVTLFWAERITEAFGLVLFDNHPDDQRGAFGDDMLSCGSWVCNVRALPCCRYDVHIRGACGLENIPSGLPVYVSVDLDVLSPEYAHTGWDQGPMTLDELCASLSELRQTRRIIGIDICGGITEAQGGTGTDMDLNRKAVASILSALRRT